MEWYLPVIWAALIGTAVVFYVILDGFDLGIGILFPFARDDGARDQMMASVAPFWDGNETWLVLGGGGLWVAFPRAYAAIMPAFYLPIIVMLVALVFRGIAFEFRGLARGSRMFWNAAFAGGSLLAAACQGVVLGGLIHGVTLDNGSFAGGAFDWATPFGLLCAVGVIVGYALLGASWLIMKAEGEVAVRARRELRVLLIAVLVAMGAVSLWTPLMAPQVAARWFTLPNILFLWPMPALTLVVAWVQWRFSASRDALPFLCSIALFVLGYIGVVISLFPYLVPPDLTIWQTAAAPASQLFMLLGTAALLPLILVYTAFIYWVFRGKVREGETYH